MDSIQEAFYKKLQKKYPETLTQVGRVDNEIDSWDLKHVAKKADEIDFLYDRDKNETVDKELLENLPVNSIIATGDARGVYVDKNLPNRVARHTITVVGHTTKGKPIIYDLGRFYEGIPKKYEKEINFILAPKGSTVNYKKEEKEKKENLPPMEDLSLIHMPGVGIDREAIELTEAPRSYYGQNVMTLLNQIFGRKQQTQ